MTYEVWHGPLFIARRRTLAAAQDEKAKWEKDNWTCQGCGRSFAYHRRGIITITPACPHCGSWATHRRTAAIREVKR